MKISTYRPNFSDDFKKKVQISEKKGGVVSLKSSNDNIYLEVKAFGRKIGLISVVKDGDSAKIIKKHIIESDFYPFEAMIYKLIKSLRRRKVKSLII